jgi:HAE1 family hydrophobic/amphiphilic exporter-1
MALAVYSDGQYDQQFLGNYSIINIQDILARIQGVGRVQVMGASDYSMRIWIKPDRLSQLNLTVPEIMASIREQNVIVPGGKFGAEPAPPGTELTYTVTLPDRLVTEDEFGEVAIRTNPDGSQVKLKDVADIELGTENYNTDARFQGKACALITIYQSPVTNAVEMGKEIIRTMDELSTSFPEGVMYDVALDATAPITAGLKEVAITLVVALILVILVVFLFIQDWRATLIPTIAIPVSLIGAFAVFPMLGFTINTLSLLGLVLAIGIVVDDAIVVVEAVQVNIEKGMNRREATIAP